MPANRLLFRRVLGDKTFDLRIQRKSSGRLPESLSRKEIKRLFAATKNLKHLAMLMTAYAGELRISEVVHLQLKRNLTLPASLARLDVDLPSLAVDVAQSQVGCFGDPQSGRI